MSYCLKPNMSENSQFAKFLYSRRFKGSHFVLSVNSETPLSIHRQRNLRDEATVAIRARETLSFSDL